MHTPHGRDTSAECAQNYRSDARLEACAEHDDTDVEAEEADNDIINPSESHRFFSAGHDLHLGSHGQGASAAPAGLRLVQVKVVNLSSSSASRVNTVKSSGSTHVKQKSLSAHSVIATQQRW